MKLKKKAVRKDKPALYIRNTVDEKTGLMTLSKDIDNTGYNLIIVMLYLTIIMRGVTMKKILYSIEISRYQDTEKRNPMNDIALPRLSLKSVHHSRPRFLSYSVMPILFSLLAGLFILTACKDDMLTMDTDNDGIINLLDVDDDNDGLIEINSLDDLNNIHHNLAGTSYKINNTDPENTNGAPASGLKGYELARGLDFNDPASYASGVVNTAWTTGSGWLPIGDNSTSRDTTRFTGILEGNGHKITNLMIRRDTLYVGLFGYIGTSGRVRNLGLENAVADYTGNSDSPNYIGLLAGQSRGSIIAVHTSGIANGGAGDDDDVGGLVGRNEGTITACHATGNANGGAGNNDIVGGLVGCNDGGTITASYATGNADGGDGNDDDVGGLVGIDNRGTITACYATGNANGGDGNDDDVGGLVGLNFQSRMITDCYATGNANGGDGDSDRVGGLVGWNEFGTITDCYATGNADGGDGNDDIVGGLVGNDHRGTITACYGFGRVTGEEAWRAVDRSDAASDSTTVGSASALTMTNSSTMNDRRWSTRVWDFGTESQVPVLKWITGYDSSGATDEAKYLCDPALLPAGRRCGDIIPGQGR